MIKAPEILTNLIDKFKISKELLASKMGVHTATIVRWAKGITNPTFAELKLLNQIYEGYKNAARKS